MELLDFKVTRDHVPIKSIDAAYMLTDDLGYIKINRFAESTYKEFKQELKRLKKRGATQMALDLRQNPGGFLNIAEQIVDEFLEDDALLFIKDNSYLNDKYDGYEFRRNNYLGNEIIDFAGWYPDYACRFFNKKTASPSKAKVHQRVEGKNIKRVNVHFSHFAWSSLHQIIAKKNQYTDWQAEQLIKTKRRTNPFTPVTHGFSSFFTCYFLKKGV